MITKNSGNILNTILSKFHTMLLKLWRKLIEDQSEITSMTDCFHVYSRKGLLRKINYSDLIAFPSITRNMFLTNITLYSQQGNISLPFFTNSKVHKRKVQSALDYKNISSYFDGIISRNIAKYNQFAVNEYLRDSSIDYLDKSIGAVEKQFRDYEANWTKYISSDNHKWLCSKKGSFPLIENVESIRAEYESKKLIEREYFYDKIESNPLTKEQRLSVIRNNDRNLVLAAAGTGKTSVIVAKALDLLDSRRYKPEEILVLAYNNAAAKELNERLSKRASSVGIETPDALKISTFHALGRFILRESYIKTHISVLAEDPRKFDKWVHDWLISYIGSSPEAMKRFIAIHYRPADPFDFATNDEYERFVRDNEYRSLSGDLVRGYQELLIANWLFINGIKFEYEAPYVTKVRVDIGYDYRPDFHIAGTNIYIEHFGINRLGETRADIDAASYRRGMISKRELHTKFNTRLIETFHYDWCEDCLETSLENQLSDLGILPNPISNDDIFNSLNSSGVIDNSAKVLQKSLRAIRVEQLAKHDVEERLRAVKVPFADKHAEILNSLHSDYIAQLNETSTIDFDDMIIRATHCVETKCFKPKWKVILVDEFQDISGSRMQFLQNIIEHGPNPTLTAVGDDWQSIYRFAGGKLELTTRFTDLVGSNTLTKLQKTFRYNNSIADTAGMFIMENDEQYRKHITTNSITEKSQIYLLDSRINNTVDSMAIRATQIVKKIREHSKTTSIAVLSRYNYLLKDAKDAIVNEGVQSNVAFWTFHGSKGLEATHCILLGFSQGRIGFPNECKDDEIVEALLPSLDSFPHSEERRLMYVALTRAKQKVYIIANPTAPSAFINELLSPKYDLNIVSTTFQEVYRKVFKCPSCTDGYFRKINGKYGEFYSCSSGLACRVKPRVCKSCGSPSIDDSTFSRCRNNNCNAVQKLCPKCARPLVLRQGRFGEFYGCSGYGLLEDQCKYTARI